MSPRSSTSQRSPDSQPPDTFVVEQQLRDIDAQELEAIITDYLAQAASARTRADDVLKARRPPIDARRMTPEQPHAHTPGSTRSMNSDLALEFSAARRGRHRPV